jgi:iron(III) transport system ATP-binding protein
MTSSKVGSVSFKNIQKTFGDFTAIPNLNLDLNPGELVTLLGPSGCGKTTTLRMLAGLETPTNGQIFIGDKDVTRLPPNQRDVAMVFQSYALFPHMTVRDNVKYGLESVGRDNADHLALEGLDLVGLGALADRYPSELSGGQQQRVAVARALVLEPEVLLLDEPLSNLDARLRRAVRTEIRQLQQELGFTAVYVTHDQEEALAVSDRIIVMRGGEVEQDGSPKELYRTPASEFIADFIGEANVLDCEVTSFDAGQAHVVIGGETYVLDTKRSEIGTARIAVRANAVRLAPPAESRMQATVKSAAYLGDKMEYILQHKDTEIFATSSNTEQTFASGAEVSVKFDTVGLALIGAGA